MKNIIYSLLIILMIIPAAFASLYPHVHSSADQYAMFTPANIDAYDTSTSLDAASGVNFPLIVYGVGALNDQKYYVSYGNNRMKFYTMIEGEMVERGNFDVSPVGSTIYRVAATSRLSPKFIVAYYDQATDTSYVKEMQMVFSGAYVSGMSTLRTFHTETGQNLMPATNIDCDYYIDSGNQKYFCAYGSLDNRIITVHYDDTDYTKIITLSDRLIDIKHDSINYVREIISSSVVASHGETYEIIINDAARRIISIDIDNCLESITCSLSSDSYSIFEITGTYIDSFTGFKTNPPNSELFMPDNGKTITFFLKKLATGSYGINITMLYDGNTLSNQLLVWSGTSHTDYDLTNIPMFVTDITESGQIQICGSSYISRYNAMTYEIMCIDPDTFTISTISSAADVNNGRYAKALGVGRIANTNDMYILINYKVSSTETIRAYHKNSSYIDISSSFAFDYPIFFSDMDNDGDMESFQSLDASSTFRYEYIPEIPIVVVDDGIDYAGLYGFYNPAQANTTQTIKARECDYITNEQCSYALSTGASFARERLCTDCDGTTSYTCGSWSYADPSITCNFSSVGTYNVNVDMEFESNPNVTQKTFSIDNWIINTDANTASNYVDVPAAPAITINQTLADDEIPSTDGSSTLDDGTFDDSMFSLIQKNIKSIIAIFFIIGVLGTLASKGIRDPIILLLIALLSMIILTIVGLLAIEYLIYVGLAILLLLMLAFIMKPQSQ